MLYYNLANYFWEGVYIQVTLSSEGWTNVCPYILLKVSKANYLSHSYATELILDTLFKPSYQHIPKLCTLELYLKTVVGGVIYYFSLQGGQLGQVVNVDQSVLTSGMMPVTIDAFGNLSDQTGNVLQGLENVQIQLPGGGLAQVHTHTSQVHTYTSQVHTHTSQVHTHTLQVHTHTSHGLNSCICHKY